MCLSKWYHKICNQAFSYKFIVAAILEEKSNIFLLLNYFYLPSNIDYKKREKVYLKHNLHAKFKNSYQTGKWGTLP